MADQWVLLIFMWVYNGGGPATAEFTSKERCEAAAKALRDMASSMTTVRTYCVPK